MEDLVLFLIVFWLKIVVTWVLPLEFYRLITLWNLCVELKYNDGSIIGGVERVLHRQSWACSQHLSNCLTGCWFLLVL